MFIKLSEFSIYLHLIVYKQSHCLWYEMYLNSINSICFRIKFLIQTCFNFHLIVFKLKLLLMTTNCLSLVEVMAFVWPPLKLWHLIPKINNFKLCQATLHYIGLQTALTAKLHGKTAMDWKVLRFNIKVLIIQWLSIW